jgi:NAD(P)-dependent dehydrogenase (short-subunit alcohol dehydrogenase family)
MDTNKVWLVTGASKGLGLSLVKKLLSEGYRVAATSRDVKRLLSGVGGEDPNLLALDVDLVDNRNVARAIDLIIRAFGTIDVVVNNAGYGQLGTIEELSDEDTRENFDVNVFGTVNVIRNVMPHFRRQKSGAFFNISSIAGFLGSFPGWGIYNATKFAVAGLTEALAAEVKSFGVTATIVYPGYFKTNFLLQGSLQLPQAPIAEYKEARQLEVIHEKEIIGNQPGDPDRAATALIQVFKSQVRPLHLFLGTDAFKMGLSKIEAVQHDMNIFETITKSTDFKKEEAVVVQ